MRKWFVSISDKMNECVNVIRYKSHFIIYFQLNENDIKLNLSLSLSVSQSVPFAVVEHVVVMCMRHAITIVMLFGTSAK